tara:strand:- start:636 stop:896 length:261 start_codon:yes stop_codon:yes gene_type:complete
MRICHAAYPLAQLLANLVLAKHMLVDVLVVAHDELFCATEEYLISTKQSFATNSGKVNRAREFKTRKQGKPPALGYYSISGGRALS